MKKESAPKGLGVSGQQLWDEVVAEYAIDTHERLVLVRACRTADVIDELQTIIDGEGLIIESSQGSRAHPALTELRQQQLLLTRLMRTLRLEFGTDEGAGRSPVRVRAANLRAVGR